MQLDARGRESEGADRARKHVFLRAGGRVRGQGERTHNPRVHCVCPLTGRGMERQVFGREKLCGRETDRKEHVLLNWRLIIHVIKDGFITPNECLPPHIGQVVSISPAGERWEGSLAVETGERDLLLWGSLCFLQGDSFSWSRLDRDWRSIKNSRNPHKCYAISSIRQKFHCRTLDMIILYLVLEFFFLFGCLRLLLSFGLRAEIKHAFEAERHLWNTKHVCVLTTKNRLTHGWLRINVKNKYM